MEDKEAVEQDRCECQLVQSHGAKHLSCLRPILEGRAVDPRQQCAVPYVECR